jgi:hypothetical protein
MQRAVFGLLACLPLAGCYVGPAYGPGPGPAYGVAGYDAYYDGGYGPFFDGYWGAGGVFFYRRGPNGPWLRDTAGHFRRAPGPGFNGVHFHGGDAGPGGHPGANAGDHPGPR